MSSLILAIFLSHLALLVGGYTSGKPPFLTRQDMCGIWKLSQPNTVSTADTTSSSSSTKGEELVLRLNDDGTFDPYTDIPSKVSEVPGLSQMLCRGGCWEFRDQTLLLAADRPPKSIAVNDTLLVGKLLCQVSECLDETEETLLEEGKAEGTTTVTEEDNMDVHLSIPKGQISSGKFMYPKKHKEFFEQPILFQQTSIGTFHMNQVLGNVNARLKSEREATQNQPVAKFHKKDFYNRTFYLTASPHPVNKGYAAADLYYDEDKATMDIRVMPITFYPNNTFTAVGTEKILRGRYGLCGDERDRLWFSVSLFGAGRSAPGSVYSEGRQLSKDDQRGYVGPVQAYPNQNNETVLFVNGEFYYGEDLKRPRKTRSWGSFTLQETNLDDDEEEDEEDSEGGSGDSRDGADIWINEEDAFQ